MYSVWITFSVLLVLCAGNSPVTGEFPAQRPVTRSFEVFFDLRLNKRLSKQSWGWWFEMSSCPLWCHCNDVSNYTQRGRVSCCFAIKGGLTHWGRVIHICVNKLTIIGSDNGLLPGQCQAIIWTNAAIFLIQTSGTNFSEILSEIHTSLFKKMHLKVSSVKRHPFCLGLNVLSDWSLWDVVVISKV